MPAGRMSSGWRPDVRVGRERQRACPLAARSLKPGAAGPISGLQRALPSAPATINTEAGAPRASAASFAVCVMKQLKLIALDAEDLEILSAHLQDAVGLVADVAYLPKEKRFVMLLNRFVWEETGGRWQRSFERRRTALHFERVEACRCRGLDPKAKDNVVNLLAIRFEPGEAPAGHVDLLFSGDVTIRLEVECVEARVKDLGPAWSTKGRPDHEAQATAPAQ